MERLSVHPRGKALTVSWATIVGATEYAAQVTAPDGTAVDGVMIGTAATFPGDAFEVVGPYTLTITAMSAQGASSTATCAFEVLEALSVVALPAINTHTAGEDLSLRWFHVANAEKYEIKLTGSSGVTVTYTTEGSALTIPGGMLSAAGQYRLVISAQADGYCPSEVTLFMEVERRGGFLMPGQSFEQGGKSDRDMTREVDTAAYKTALVAAPAWDGMDAFVESLPAALSGASSVSMMKLMQLGMASLPEAWGDARYADAMEAYYKDYAAATVALLTDIASSSGVITASAVVQITAGAVGDILEMLLAQGNALAPEARKALTAYRASCTAVAASAVFDELPSLRQEVMILTVARILDKNDVAAMAVLDAMLRAFARTGSESVAVRVLDMEAELLRLHAEKWMALVDCLPGTASLADVEAVHTAYQTYVLSLAHLSQMTGELLHEGVMPELAQALEAEKRRLEGAQAAYELLLLEN